METQTKITQSNVRVALSHNYSTFEVSMQLENENGINVDEISDARIKCQKLATDAVNEYKKPLNSTTQQEIKKIENKISEIKKDLERDDEVGMNVSPEEIEQVETLPLWSEKKATEKPAKTKSKKS